MEITLDNLQRVLTEQVEVLLKLPKSVGITTPVTNKMTEILAEISGVSADFNMSEWSDKSTAYGIAISPVQAARCCRETLRTQVFLKAVLQAIQEALKKQQTVHLLYAGTGPFGTIVLPLLFMFTAKQLQVTLLDIHQENIDAIRRVVTALGIEQQIKEYVCADASCWQPEDGEEFDIVVSETMNTFLRREPQVAIFAHLQQFLIPDGVLIPENIKLDSWLMDETSLTVSDNLVTHIGEVFSLNKKSAKQVHEQGFDALKGNLQLPVLDKLSSKIAFTTRIQVYGEHQLLDGECSLNMLEVVHSLDLRSEQKVDYFYAQQPVVKFVFDLPLYQPEQDLVAITDYGRLKINHIKRMWHKFQSQRYGQQDTQLIEHEWPLDMLLVKFIGGELYQWLTYLHQERLVFSVFEQWLETQFGPFSDEKLKKINKQLLDKYAELN